MSARTIGTCSLCGGPVQVPLVWSSIFAPTPECADCHAIAVNHHGPVIRMRAAPEVRAYTGTNSNKLELPPKA